MAPDAEWYNSLHTGQTDEDQGSDSRYRYEPLAAGSSSFRFAYLLPGRVDDGIRVRLETRVVESDQESEEFQWEALSWLWGVYGDFRTILVNDREFQVTRNLFIALRHLRRENTARLFWIDALCIN